MNKGMKCPKCIEQMYYHEPHSTISDYFEEMDESLLPNFACWICFECHVVVEDEDYKYDDVEKRAR